MTDREKWGLIKDVMIHGLGEYGMAAIAYLALCEPDGEVSISELHERAGIWMMRPNPTLRKMERIGFIKLRPEVKAGTPGRIMISLAKKEEANAGE